MHLDSMIADILSKSLRLGIARFAVTGRPVPTRHEGYRAPDYLQWR